MTSNQTTSGGPSGPPRTPRYRLAVYSRDGKLAVTHASSSLAAARGLARQFSGVAVVEQWNGAEWVAVAP